MAAGPSWILIIVFLAGLSVAFMLLNALMVRIGCRVIKVDVPRFTRACFVSLLVWVGIVAVSIVFSIAFAILMGTVLPDPDATTPARATQTLLVWTLISEAMQVVIWALLSGVVYKVFVPLPTFGRAMLVWAITFAFWLVIGIVLYGVAFVYLYQTGYGV